MKRFLLCSVKSVKVVLACLLALAFVSYGSLALADYEVTDYTADSPPPSETPTQWTNDVTVQWEAPSFSDPYTLVKFVYKWTTSESALNYTQLNADDSSTYTPNGGIVEKDVTPYHADLSSEEIAGDDYNVLRYLHLKTVYRNNATPPNFYHSDDKVIGPFNIDNVVTGTLRLPDPDDPDKDLQETRQTQITVKVGYPDDVAENGLYLNETSTRPSQGLPYTTTTYTLQNTDPGSKTIYAWFQDQAGNISSTPEAASFTLLEQVSIDPNTATIDLAVTDTRTFQVAGTSDGYTWTVINEIPETAGENVADLTGTTANVNSVTLQGLNPGTCQLTAQYDSITLTSGAITVKEGTVSKTFSLITTATTNTNTIGFIFNDTGLTTAHELGTAVGNCDLVSKWDATTQSYLSHPMAYETVNNFSLQVGEAYFVSVTQDRDFTLTGTFPPSLTAYLITTATINTNAVGLPYSKSHLTKAHALGLDVGNCDLVAKWDATTQSYLSHPMAYETVNNFDIEWGQGYFISVTQDTDWSW